MKKNLVFFKSVFFLFLLRNKCVFSADCSTFDGDACACRFNRVCEYNHAKSKCVERDTECAKPYDGGLCRWGGKHVFYSVGGVICPSKVASGECFFEKAIRGVNFNGVAHVGVKGLEFDGHVEPDVDNVVEYRETETVEGVPEEDRDLYETYIWASAIGSEVQGCMTYLFPTAGDGKYELSLKLAEHYEWRNESRKRDSSIQINGQYIVSQFDPIVYRKKMNGFDINANFEISDGETMLEIEGYPASKIETGRKEVELTFCLGTCGWDDENPDLEVSAFSVGKFAGIPSCPDYDGNSCGCRSNKACEYDEATEKCFERIEGCAPSETDECRRSDEHIFYSVGGLVCHSNQSSGECYLQRSAWGVNFNGKPHTDVNGIEYSGHVDPDSKSFTYRAKNLNLKGVPPDDLDLYQYHIKGVPRDGDNDGCATYMIEKLEDGKYEISLKMAEHDRHRDPKVPNDWSVQLNGQYIVNHFDPLLYRAYPYAFDLNSNFEISGGGTMLKLEGYSSAKKIDSAGNEIQLSFCFGTCEWPIINTHWHVGAVSVAKIGPKPGCYLYEGDRCECHAHRLCEYNEATGKCIDSPDECDSPLKGELCRRAGEHIFYSNAGVICRSNQSAGECWVEKSVWGINFNGEAHVDINEIEYSPHIDPASDASQVTVNKGVVDLKGVPAEDIDLYQRYIWGAKVNDKGDGCAVYKVPIVGDGKYEASFKVGEHNMARNATITKEWSIQLHGQYIASNFDPLNYRPVQYGFDLNANFEIFEGETMFMLEGHPAIKIENGAKELELKLCFGTCEWEGEIQNWHIGAVSVAKLGEKPCCADYDGDSCGCRLINLCEYNDVTNECDEREKECIPPKGDYCRRNGQHIFYTEGGVICPSRKSSGNCYVEKTVWAINLNGEGHTDVNGIEFLGHVEPSLSDAYIIYGKVPILGIPNEDANLYETYIWGVPHDDLKDGCAFFIIPTAGDGKYEISLKLAEHDKGRNESIQRDISIFLNNQYLVSHFDPITYRPVNFGMDLNANFDILEGETMILIEGHPPTKILTRRKKLIFKVCFGGCKEWPGKMVERLQWKIGGISVAKFGTKPSCADFNGDACTCRLNRICEYNVTTDKCVERAPECSPPVHYDKCRRSGDHVFYVNGGVVCWSSRPVGECLIEKTVWAVNFNGNAHTDVNGVVFKGHTKPAHSRADVNEGNVNLIEGVPRNDVDLYKSYIWGLQRNNTKDGCVYFIFPTAGDGQYEVSLKLAVHFDLMNETVPRDFNIQLNDRYIISHLDPVIYRASPLGFDLNANFEILENETMLKLEGHPASKIQTRRKKVVLKLCFGTCTNWEGITMDHLQWHVGAISVVKLEIDNKI